MKTILALALLLPSISFAASREIKISDAPKYFPPYVVTKLKTEKSRPQHLATYTRGTAGPRRCTFLFEVNGYSDTANNWVATTFSVDEKATFAEEMSGSRSDRTAVMTYDDPNTPIIVTQTANGVTFTAKDNSAEIKIIKNGNGFIATGRSPAEKLVTCTIR